MKRRLYKFACMFSLAIALASALGWVASHFMRAEVRVHVRGPSQGMASSSLGTSGLRLVVWQPNVIFEPPIKRLRFSCFMDGRVGSDPYLDEIDVIELVNEAIVWKPSRGLVVLPLGTGTTIRSFVLVPCWLVLLLSLPLPLIWARGLWTRRRAIASGCCTSCGYDLRGSPPEGDCPECGATRPAGVESPLATKGPS